jgi:hypothetical protein
MDLQRDLFLFSSFFCVAFLSTSAFKHNLFKVYFFPRDAGKNRTTMKKFNGIVKCDRSRRNGNTRMPESYSDGILNDYFEMRWRWPEGRLVKQFGNLRYYSSTKHVSYSLFHD